MKFLPFLSLLFAGSAFADAPPAEDRTAILGMAGEFAVTFHFEETVALKADYALKKPYTEAAHELVVVAKDEPRHIELQHLLVADGMVIKHWRQVWTYEDTRICEFQGSNTWRMRDLTADEARGTWTQLVTQVDDSPRYESWGSWQHRAGISSWTSGETWRPLPRRESGRSKEYQVVAGTNRHTLTPQGWVHEQDNTKTVVADGKVTGVIARELGVNTYRRVKPDEKDKVDFTPARKMWEKDGAFWNSVVDTWADLQKSKSLLKVSDNARLSELREAVSKLKDTPPAQPGGWPVKETILNFLTNSDPPAQ
ncbi:MAG TPA: DUF6607 family protein [Verrucomicrobiales bacterium]|nr:DUF6607 family protein [Verrucomicrobiales bacterium]